MRNDALQTAACSANAASLCSETQVPGTEAALLEARSFSSMGSTTAVPEEGGTSTIARSGSVITNSSGTVCLI